MSIGYMSFKYKDFKIDIKTELCDNKSFKNLEKLTKEIIDLNIANLKQLDKIDYFQNALNTNGISFDYENRDIIKINCNNYSIIIGFIEKQLCLYVKFRK